jgi:hypothetical protein
MKHHFIYFIILSLISLQAFAEEPETATKATKATKAGESEFDRIRRAHGENANKLFGNALKKKGLIPLHGAFTRLWLNSELPKANQLLHDAQQAIIKQEKGKGEMTVEIASSEHVKWQMRTWNRIYQLFHDKSRFHPGRLDKKTQAMIEEMFWFYVCEMSRFERAAPQHVWGIHNSENHEMMHYSNALLALQALKESPTYKDRMLPDGHSLKEHYEGWNAYYKWDNEVFLRMADGNAPVALIAGRSADFASIDAFASYLGTFSGTPKDGWFKLSGGKDEKLTLSLHLASEALPRVNGTHIDLRPGMLFDSPFMSSEHGSGIVTIRKGGRELKIDMNK